MLKLNPYDPVFNYQYAICLHMQNKNLEKSLEFYKKSLKYGFEEFWVRYNRGSLFVQNRKNRSSPEGNRKSN